MGPAAVVQDSDFQPRRPQDLTNANLNEPGASTTEVDDTFGYLIGDEDPGASDERHTFG